MDREAIRARFDRIKERAFRKVEAELAGLGRSEAAAGTRAVSTASKGSRRDRSRNPSAVPATPAPQAV